MVVLDWKNAEPYILTLSRDNSSRLSTIPRDIVDTIVPHLHTWNDKYGQPRYNEHLNGTVVIRDACYTCRIVYLDGEYQTIQEWSPDGSLVLYREYAGHSMVSLNIRWNNDCIYVSAYPDVKYNTLPDIYRYVWEIMTRVVDVNVQI